VISGKQCGSLPSELSYLELESAHAMVSAVKKSEDQTGTIIRVYETNGQEDDCTLKMNGKVHQAFETDFLEKKQKELNVQSGNLISFMLKPYEIKTIYINGGLNE